MIQHLVRFGGLAICATLLWFAVDWADAARLMSQADVRLLAGAVVLLTLQTVLSAERWRITAAQLGIRFRFGHALREYYLSQVINQSVPGGIVGDAGRAVRSRDSQGLLPSAQAVIFERLAGQLGLICVFALGVVLSFLTPAPQRDAAWITPSALLAAVAVIAIVFATGILLRRFEPTLRAGRRFWLDFTQAVCAKPVWKRQVALSLATACCNIAAFACCTAAIGTTLGLVTSITLIPLILFSMLLPLSIGGWGLREGAAAVLFPLWGATAEAGFAASVTFGLMILVSIAPFFLIGWRAPKAKVEQDGDLP